MMFWYDHGAGGWGWLAMPAGMIIFWALVVGAGVLLFRALGRTARGDVPAHREAPDRPTPEQVLAERFARGEIDEDEYRHRLAVLHGTPTSHT